MKMRCVMAGVVLCSAVVGAQGPMDKPGPEQKNIARFAGSWKMEGTIEPSPLGPGGKMTGTQNCAMFEGGWHLVCENTGSAPMGSIKGHSVITYDRAAKQYRHFSVNNMPDAQMATGTLSGDTWTWNSSMDQGGQKIHSRFVIVEKSPTVHTFKWEMSMDGAKWMTMMNGTSTKTGS
jgi:hypothetical protein